MSHNDLATKHDIRDLKQLINQLGVQLMTIISDFADAQAAFNKQEDAAIATLQTEVAALQAAILALASSGSVSPADQAALNAISVHSQAVSDQLNALDALAAPVPPVTPPAPMPVPPLVPPVR